MKEITIEQREKVISNGANWMFWIAGATALNSILYFFGQKMNFIFGLAIAQFVDGVLTDQETTLRIIGLVISLAMAGLYVYLGLLGRKRNKKAIYIGLVIFALDSLLSFYVKDYWGFGFHVVAVLSMNWAIKNIKIVNELKEIESIGSELEIDTSFQEN